LKQDLGWIVVFVDLVIIITFLTFTNILEKSQKTYVKSFKDDTIEMTDFTIRVKPMPHDAKYGDTDATLRAFLMAHFEAIIKDEFNERQQYRSELNSTRQAKDFDNLFVTKHT